MAETYGNLFYSFYYIYIYIYIYIACIVYPWVVPEVQKCGWSCVWFWSIVLQVAFRDHINVTCATMILAHFLRHFCFLGCKLRKTHHVLTCFELNLQTMQNKLTYLHWMSFCRGIVTDLSDSIFLLIDLTLMMPSSVAMTLSPVFILIPSKTPLYHIFPDQDVSDAGNVWTCQTQPALGGMALCHHAQFRTSSTNWPRE